MTTLMRGSAALLITTCLAGAAAAQSELTFWQHGAGNPWEPRIFGQIVDDFNASQSDWKVTLQQFPQAAYNDSVTAAALSGELPDIIDVVAPFKFTQPAQLRVSGRFDGPAGAAPRGEEAENGRDRDEGRARQFHPNATCANSRFCSSFACGIAPHIYGPRGFAPRGDMGAPRGADRGDFAPRKPAFAKNPMSSACCKPWRRTASYRRGRPCLHTLIRQFSVPFRARRIAASAAAD